MKHEFVCSLVGMAPIAGSVNYWNHLGGSNTSAAIAQQAALPVLREHAGEPETATFTECVIALAKNGFAVVTCAIAHPATGEAFLAESPHTELFQGEWEPHEATYEAANEEACKWRGSLRKVRK